MRRTTLSFLAVSALFLLFLSACSKNNNSGTPNGSCTATVNGSAYTGTATLGAFSVPLNLLAIVSYSIHPGDTTAFQINIPYPPRVNKPFISDSLILAYISKGTEYDAQSSHGQLQLTVTSIDSIGHKIAGNFTANAHSFANYNDSVIITNGAFNCPYNVNP